MSSDRLKLRYVYGGAVTYPPGATFGPRALRDFELVWIVAGNVVYHADGADYAAPPGAIILGRPGFKDRFTWDPDRPTRHVFLHFDVAALPADWPAADDWPVIRLMPKDDVVRPLFRYVLRYCQRQRPADDGQVKFDAMLVRSLETLVGAYVTGPVSQGSEHDRDYPEAVKKALRYMQTQIAENPGAVLTLAEVAQTASVSQEHLCRLFRQTFDVGPIEAHRLMRLETAMGLLARSNLNIEQIADRTGFASPYHFSRRFKQVYGQPPTTMRKLLIQGQAPPASHLVRHTPELR